jgi:hypothetical protein
MIWNKRGNRVPSFCFFNATIIFGKSTFTRNLLQEMGMVKGIKCQNEQKQLTVIFACIEDPCRANTRCYSVSENGTLRLSPDYHSIP